MSRKPRANIQVLKRSMVAVYPPKYYRCELPGCKFWCYTEVDMEAHLARGVHCGKVYQPPRI